MKSYLALVICSILAMQAVSMNGDDEDQVLPGPRCITEACGKFIIINGQVVPNTDGECQKNKPADAWYAMQNQSLCHRVPVPWNGPKDYCWCVVPKCKPVKCGTQAFNDMVDTKESKCYSEKQNNMVCRQSGDLCKEIANPFNGESRPCYCCWKSEIVIPPVSGCKDKGCGSLWQGKGECVNVTSVAFSKIEAEYDLRYSNAYYNKRCAPADPKSDKDCCLCMKKKPCVDKGCIGKGGMCVDMKNAQLGNANYGVRSEVDLDSPLGDDLCANDPSSTSRVAKQCCTCYKKKEN